MRKFILLLFVLTFFLSASAETTYQLKQIPDTTINMTNLIEALITVESNGNPYALSKDSTCVGVLQIKEIVVDDCNEYLKIKGINKRYSYEDRYNRNKSIEMFYLIQERYRNFRTERSETYIEHMIRLWNGGCGYYLKSTQSYYEKVISIYTKKQSN